jgi:flagellar motor component MotA
MANLDEYNGFNRDLTKEEREKEFLETLTRYFASGSFLISDSGANKIEMELERLNTNLKNASESSTKLAKALNTITFWGVVVAILGVIVTILIRKGII